MVAVGVKAEAVTEETASSSRDKTNRIVSSKVRGAINEN